MLWVHAASLGWCNLEKRSVEKTDVFFKEVGALIGKLEGNASSH